MVLAVYFLLHENRKSRKEFVLLLFFYWFLFLLQFEITFQSGFFTSIRISELEKQSIPFYWLLLKQMSVHVYACVSVSASEFESIYVYCHYYMFILDVWWILFLFLFHTSRISPSQFYAFFKFWNCSQLFCIVCHENCCFNKAWPIHSFFSLHTMFKKMLPKKYRFKKKTHTTNGTNKIVQCVTFLA